MAVQTAALGSTVAVSRGCFKRDAWSAAEQDLQATGKTHGSSRGMYMLRGGAGADADCLSELRCRGLLRGCTIRMYQHRL